MRWLKRILLTLLAVIVLLVAWFSIVFYVKSKPYRQLTDSWVFRENQGSSIIGDLGGMPVAIPRHFARFVEYQGDPHFLEPRKGSPPTRTSQSKLRSFGFEVRFPDMAGLTDKTREEKRQSNIYNTMWLSVGVEVAPYNNELGLKRQVDAIPSPSKIWVLEGSDRPDKTWKEPHGYLRSANLLYGLVVYEVQNYDDAKRYRMETGGNGVGDETIYYHVGEQNKVDTYIWCSNVKHHAAPCEQSFVLPTVKNTMVEVGYRIGLLPQWREIQDSVSKVILGFAVDSKSNTNKIETQIK